MFRKLAISAIKAALWCLDKDHRQPEQISLDNDKKFTHVQDINLKSDFGTAVRAFRTVPYWMWELKTTSKTLLAADRHRVIREDGEPAWLEDLLPGDLLKTDNGLEPVVSCRPLNIRTHMYCLQTETDDPNDPNNHLFYTDGILSHNTTCAAGYLLWKAMFSPDTTILIAANKFVQALEIMDRIRYAYENLPDHIRAGCTEYNKGTLTFDNGSKIVARATSPDAGRGLSITLLYLDEFAFVHKNKADAFYTSMAPVLATGGSCIITSTPLSDEDMFAKLWFGATKTIDEFGNPLTNNGEGENGFFAFEAPWWHHPERDETWAARFRTQLGQAKFAQEFEGRFVTSDDTLIESMLLSKMKGSEPIQYTGTMRWYQVPEPNKTYLVALDPSLGVGRDNAAIQVFQLPEMRQIAEWQHNRSAPRQQVRVLMQTLLYIEGVMLDNPDQIGEPEIFWSVENNSIGEALLTIIEDTGEDRFPGMMVSENRRRNVSRFRKGMNTTNKSKLSACARFKSLVETGRMSLKSKNLIKELKMFVALENSFKAKPGETDDLVSAALLITRMLDVVVRWSNEDMDTLREHIQEEELMDNEHMPILHSDYL